MSMIGHDAPTRIVAGGELDPEEYTAKIEFEGWEREDGSNETGWDVSVFDDRHGIYVTLRLTLDGNDNPEVQTLLRYATGS